jgi:hypothetical protein
VLGFFGSKVDFYNCFSTNSDKRLGMLIYLILRIKQV